MRIAELILKKRGGESLTKEEIDFFVKAVVDQTIEDSQLGKFIDFFLFFFHHYYYHIKKKHTGQLTLS